ncbi:hypothetical protein ACV2Y0_22730 [Enterobacter hormaechei]|uniref:Uncharacterized protein n=1 Tax=Klebsiella pneumoniae TaxID=573 RepID=A0A6M3HCU4_KLEPN|nr:hypothetical protein [Citrobacter freundii]QIS32112.1 hypothetical protein [Klebsiella pneumoniae]
MVTSSGQTESIEDVIDVDLESGCRFSGIEAPAVVEWSTEGKWRRSPAQPAAVLTGSANPFPRPDKPYPLKTSQTPLYAVGVVTTRRQPQSGRISALAGRRAAYERVPDN